MKTNNQIMKAKMTNILTNGQRTVRVLTLVLGIIVAFVLATRSSSPREITVAVIGVTLTCYGALQFIRLHEVVSQLNLSLEQSQKRLTSFSLNQIQKNAVLDEMSEKVASLKKQADPDMFREFNQLHRGLQETFNIDKEWENFNVFFEGVHNGFVQRLKSYQPELTHAEVKLCALVKLNLTLKESANVLGISPDSVKTARYRLKKRLLLGKEESLTEFLERMDTYIAA